MLHIIFRGVYPESGTGKYTDGVPQFLGRRGDAIVVVLSFVVAGLDTCFALLSQSGDSVCFIQVECVDRQKLSVCPSTPHHALHYTIALLDFTTLMISTLNSRWRLRISSTGE